MPRTLVFVALATLIVGAAYLAFGRASPPAQQAATNAGSASSNQSAPNKQAAHVARAAVLTERLSPENRDRLLQFVRANEAIPFEDRLLFARGMQRVFYGSGNDGKTVGQVIEEQRKFERDFAQQMKKHHPPAPLPKKTAR
jgi:hypothetical protein